MKSWKFGIQIPPKVKCGYGLYIGHGMSIIVNPTTVLGNNVNLSQFTSIGSNSGKAANIGNNVYIGPNVCIIGNKNIGDEVIIGAGSVITKDIEPYSIAVGVPCEKIKSIQYNQYIGNRWIC